MVLGVSVNSRIIGLAIIEKEGLYDFATKMHSGEWNAEKLERMIESIFAFTVPYHITSVALTIPSSQYLTDQIKMFLEAIVFFVRKTGVPLYQYTTEQVHEIFQTGKNRKQGLMNAISFLYPELLHVQKKELRNHQDYYHKIFEAVATAAIHSRDKT